MGLDMYLYRDSYVKQWSHQAAADQFSVAVTRGGEPFTAIDPAKIAHVVEEVAYWRKANAIHKWFVDNCQGGVDDCRPKAYVDKAQVIELVELCRLELERKDEPGTYLPPQEGFFFGSTNTDEWYYQDLADTVKQLRPLTKPATIVGWYADLYYHSSW